MAVSIGFPIQDPQKWNIFPVYSQSTAVDLPRNEKYLQKIGGNDIISSISSAITTATKPGRILSCLSCLCLGAMLHCPDISHTKRILHFDMISSRANLMTNRSKVFFTCYNQGYRLKKNDHWLVTSGFITIRSLSCQSFLLTQICSKQVRAHTII